MRLLMGITLLLMAGADTSAGKWRYSRVYEPKNPTQQFSTTLTGLDVLVNDDLRPLRGKRVAVVTNHTGLNREGEFILDIFAADEDITLGAVFSPEHGLFGRVSDGVAIGDSDQALAGVKIYSLYGQTRKPTPDQLAGIDLVIFDMQDVGARYYTYPSTMTLVMDACARDGVPLWVLDRPNPVRGDIIDGPLLDLEYASFVGMHPVPIRHGMTLGELAVMINEQGWLTDKRRVRLTVVPVLNWSRFDWWEDTHLEWVPPSPNIPTPETALAYLGTCLLEGTNISEGRGTHEPFLICGAPWIEGASLAEQLNRRQLPGVEFEEHNFTPKSIVGMSVDPKYRDQDCGGVRIKIVDRAEYEPLYTATVLLHVIRESYPRQFEWRERHLDRLWGSDALRRYIDQGRNIQALPSTYSADRDAFYSQRKQYLIYNH
ncbi:MAG: DUF1343 domain-containing protein [Candidatus Marinimicrobia bacterium]|nr:DUF1343 domain-containing protein [Candidatus Neomarinimicrobiota bacterium]